MTSDQCDNGGYVVKTADFPMERSWRISQGRLNLIHFDLDTISSNNNNPSAVGALTFKFPKGNFSFPANPALDSRRPDGVHRI
jgi:hypothetical protein